MNERDETRLRDMLDAAYKAQQFIAGKNRTMLDDDDMLAFALVRAIEIIGEAATKISSETHSMLPEVKWHEVTGMRNRIVHDYLNVDLNIVWVVATRDIPILIDQLDAFLSSD